MKVAELIQILSTLPSEMEIGRLGANLSPAAMDGAVVVPEVPRQPVSHGDLKYIDGVGWPVRIELG